MNNTTTGEDKMLTKKSCKTALLLVTILTANLVSGCMAWSTDDSPDEYVSDTVDRHVYCELDTDDVIDMLDGVMKDKEDGWPYRGQANCLEHMLDVDLQLVDSVEDKCYSSDYACIYAQLSYGYVATHNRSQLDVYNDIGHELIHFVAWCFYGDADGSHGLEGVWYADDNDGNIEATLRAEIYSATREDACALLVE